MSTINQSPRALSGAPLQLANLEAPHVDEHTKVTTATPINHTSPTKMAETTTLESTLLRRLVDQLATLSVLGVLLYFLGWVYHIGFADALGLPFDTFDIPKETILVAPWAATVTSLWLLVILWSVLKYYPVLGTLLYLSIAAPCALLWRVRPVRAVVTALGRPLRAALLWMVDLLPEPLQRQITEFDDAKFLRPVVGILGALMIYMYGAVIAIQSGERDGRERRLHPKPVSVVTRTGERLDNVGYVVRFGHTTVLEETRSDGSKVLRLTELNAQDELRFPMLPPPSHP